MERDIYIYQLLHRLKISTHTLTWSVTLTGAFFIHKFKNFNSHAHVERDTDALFFSKTAQNFNSHAHVERDSDLAFLNLCMKNFNSHAHVERDKLCAHLVKLVANFNSHAHVERDVQSALLILYIRISTHTLTWSVTFLISYPIYISIFQLTRSRGA